MSIPPETPHGGVAAPNGDTQMSALLRAHDWSTSPLGPPAGWPQSLRTAVDIMISSKHPMFVAWGPELGFVYNDAYAAILGKKHPWALGLPFSVIWAEIWDDIEPLVARALAGEATWSENLHLVMERNGFPEDTWYSFSYSPIRDESQRIAGMFCACTETTAQVLAVRRSSAERERLFELTRDLFAVATFDGYLRSINPAWSKVLGRPEHELLTEPFVDIIHPADLAVTARVVEALRDGGSVHQFRVRLLRADGAPVSFAWSAVSDESGDSGVFYTVGRDITEDLRREETLRQSHKMEAMGQLTGGIAHDFNNLLQAVQGNLDLIRRRPKDADRVLHWATNGLQAAERGTKLTAQLLAFSRAQKMEIRPTAIAPLIAGMQDLFRQSLGPLVDVKLQPVDADVGALVDPTQLEMALLNIAINARDALPDGGELIVEAGRRTIEHEVELDAGSYVEIRMTDNGAGMSPDVARRAFDPFFTTKGVGKGSGLGLSQVYAMTRQAGGVARIRSTEGVGTTIVVLLRFAQPDVPRADDAPAGLAGLRPAGNVLVIDDDVDVRQFLDDSLQSLGYNVTAVADGAQGLSLMDSVKPDVLILDFAMPGLNGAEVASVVRRQRPTLPIVFATGYSESAAVEAAVGGSALLLKKPFMISDLEAVLQLAVAAS